MTGPGGGGALLDFAFDPANSERVYLTSDMTGVFVSEDAGDHWKWSSYGASKQKGGIAIDPGQPDILYTVGQDGVYRSSNKAESWELIYSRGNGFQGVNNMKFGPMRDSIFGKPGQSISVSPAGVVFVGTVTGDIVISRDRGRSFTRVSTGGSSEVRNIIPTSGKNVVASLLTDGIYLSRDEGITWENTLELPDRNLLGIAVHPDNRNILYALTCERAGVFIHTKTTLPVYLSQSTDGGSSWESVHKFDKLTIRKGRRLIDVSKEGTIMILAAIEPLRSVDGGKTWSYPKVVSQEDDGFIYAVRNKWGGTKRSIYADHRKAGRWFMTGMGAALRSDDDGKTWYYKVRGLREQAYWFIRVNPLNPDIIMAGDLDHGLIRSIDGGKTWRDIVIVSPYEECDELLFSPDDETYSVMYSFCLYPYPFIALSADKGETWSLLKTWKDRKRMSMSRMALTRGEEHPAIFTGEPGVGIWNSIDHGKSWTRKNKGLPRPEEITYIQFLDSDNRGNLYVGIASDVRGKGGIFSSGDGGNRWFPINNGLESLFVRRRSFAIDPNNPDVLWVSAGGAVYRSRNCGVSWEKRIEGINSSAILVEPGNSDIVYVSSYSGGGFLKQYSSGIFKSVDGGNYFFEITGDLLRTIGSNYQVFDFEYGWEGSGKIWAAPDGGGLIFTVP